MIKLFRKLFGRSAATSADNPAAQTATQPADLTPTQPHRREKNRAMYSGNQEALAYLEKMQHKIRILAERFATGGVNRQQFEELFSYYQNEIQVVEQILVETPETDEWKSAITDGQSMIIRRRTTARMVGFSIYINASGVPIKTCGQFTVDPALFVPMLHAFQSATKEIFGAQQRLTQIENGKWLGYFPGQITTMLVVFSLEPSQKQIVKLEELQKVFERANHAVLQQMVVDVNGLVCPQEFFITHTL